MTDLHDKEKGEKYQIIYADPPWEYNREQYEKPGNNHSKQQGATKGAKDKYPLMNTNDICDLPLKNITDKNCLLFLWVTSPKLKEGMFVGESWGFKYITIGFVWHKKRVNPGNYTMSVCELCLIFKKGKIPLPRGKRNVEQFYFEMRKEHSKKPDEIRKRIEQMFPTQNKIELFARQKTEGWDVWGNEVTNDIKL